VSEVCPVSCYVVPEALFPRTKATTCVLLVLTLRVPHLSMPWPRRLVSLPPPTAEAWFRSRVSPCGICGGQSGTGTGFSPNTSVLSLSISLHRCSITSEKLKTNYPSLHLHHRVAQLALRLRSPSPQKKKITSFTPKDLVTWCLITGKYSGLCAPYVFRLKHSGCCKTRSIWSKHKENCLQKITRKVFDTEVLKRTKTWSRIGFRKSNL
jgi:hypothetical protein